MRRTQPVLDHEKPRLIQIANRYRPPGVKFIFREGNQLTPAHAVQHADGSREIHTPVPDTREALYIYLHEVGHMTLGHCRPTSKLPNWREEYEAEMWAIQTMRREGIPVPRRMIIEAKKYIRSYLKIDKEAVVPYKIKAWLGMIPKR